ncbi:hypothetical protein AGR7A_Cc210149 [Agrobacterium deltaense NCPPB 1641]|uniref:Bacterial bifunctional deaminase-reductase C-terminal domain-containing protein n=1 Tax=Agrobacterium deltaense NCPPB 1641 TaxID=1183425 RepID=A0A1S7TMX1_9HYPH|nr:hypothetical protein AGR7A_Cc210149 [Agrobacterium deltaense NCPPB 1641]
MPKAVVRNFAISLDGYDAGPDQSLQNPLGVNGEELHQWLVPGIKPTRVCAARESFSAQGLGLTGFL